MDAALYLSMGLSQIIRWLSVLFLFVGIATRSNPVLGQEVKSGSGFIFHPDGYILTNKHVVADSAELLIVLSNGSRLPAKLIAADPKTDIALLKVPGSNFPTLPIGESEKISVMDTVLAMGFPMSSTIGYDVSAYDGKVNAIRQSETTPLFQIDANINPGNSGGPLLNDLGEVIGIVVSKINAIQLAKTMGAIPERINFAIPIDQARSMIRKAYPSGYTPSHRSVPLRDQEIFAESKDATVLILAPKKVQTSGRPVTETQSQQNELPPDIFGGNTTQPVAMKPSLLAFVQAFIQSGSSDRLESAMQFYAPHVEYNDKGVVDADFIRKEISEFWRRWPRREYRLSDDPIARAGPEPDQFLVTYHVGYVLRGRRNELHGISEVTVLVKDDDGTYSVLAVHENLEKNGSSNR